MSTLDSEAGFDMTAREYQAKADQAYVSFGTRAPMRVSGESVLDYRRRLINPMLSHSDRWKNATAATLTETVLPVVEAQVYADAAASVRTSTGDLREVVERDQSGRSIHKFYGDPENVWGPFKMAGRLVTGWRTK